MTHFDAKTWPWVVVFDGTRVIHCVTLEEAARWVQRLGDHGLAASVEDRAEVDR